ncbi:DUF1131 family protein [Aquimarina algiphila]|uniref:DUF1131 family protein n=1 Tax=Aquimarina algiphila TaxID=2047982 RepID=UPI0023306167|nr:DUF1131 family protein [Aquimarina algiphila]
MRKLIICLLVVGNISCGNNRVYKDNAEKNTSSKTDIEKELTEKPIKVRKTNDQRIVIFENRIDTFPIPFQEKDILMGLKSYYKSYNVEAKIGQQDGPNFPYIDIVKNDGNSVMFFSFDYENKNKLDEIRILDSIAADQYGIRVGDSYQKIVEKRKGDFKNSTDYHQHTYLYAENSNIYYELTGDITITEDMLENLEELELSEEQLQKCKVEYIIWRKRNQ